MASLIRRSYTKLDKKTGTRRRRRSRKYYGQYRDADGVIRRVPLCTDKAAAQAMLNQIVREVDRQSAGLANSATEQQKRSLHDQIADFESYLKSKGNTTDHVDQTISRIRAMFGGCKFHRLSDLSGSRVLEWLADAREGVTAPVDPQPAGSVVKTYSEIAAAFGVSVSTVTYWRRQGAPIRPRKKNDLEAIWRWRIQRKQAERGQSIATSNHYLRAVKSFGRWLVRERRLQENPFAHLSLLNAQTDVRRERRTLSPSEFVAFIEATRRSERSFRGLDGNDRAMLYLTAANTGLRASELASLRPSSLELYGDMPAIKVAAGYSKRRRNDEQPIRTDLAGMLCNWIDSRGVAGDVQLWPGTWKDESAEMVRRDLKVASIPYTDDEGRVFDFHALRHQFISNLAVAGVHPKVAQQLARHSTIGLTMDRYTHLQVADVAGALDQLPAVPSGDLGPSEAIATSGRLALGLALDSVSEGQSVAARDKHQPKNDHNQESRKPLEDKGFGKERQVVSLRVSSEADGTRTRNHRIDSPVL